MKEDIVSRLRQFLDDEAMLCSMDYGCNTPLYVYRMWGGEVAIENIATAMEEVGRMRHIGFMERSNTKR